ncbi:hypothetical protein [Chondromyces apiculatus]|uniref:Spore-associated protein A n=1 Tax=Chondromyces apiculatus DSM 436 TaxID=1192034 RepID=A0A017T1Q3_9BACT|nr:hypothetical protein [Chondromyces apiculatus]EYF02780.1 Spore-associated protein A precursor [Chondromyces apiculatus DSM 436]
MKTMHHTLVPFMLIAASAMLGGCIGTEADEEADDLANEDEILVDDVEPTAEAVSAATYNGVCGSGYHVIASHALSGGTVFLTYNSSTGKNCVVTVRNTSGARLPMTARVSKAGQPWIVDSGQFTTYAGPVYVYAPHACIDWGGSINGSNFNDYGVFCG